MKLIVKALESNSTKTFDVSGNVKITIEDGIMYLIDNSEKTKSLDLDDEDISISFDTKENISKETKQAEEIKMLRTEDTFEIYQLMRAGFVVSKNSPYQVYHPLTNVEVCRVTSALFDYIANQKLVDNSNSMYLTLKGE